MPNGRQGDNPVTDITNWGLEPFAADINRVIREIVELSGGLTVFDEDDDLTELVFEAEADASREPELRRRLLDVRERLRLS